MSGLFHGELPNTKLIIEMCLFTNKINVNQPQITIQSTLQFIISESDQADMDQLLLFLLVFLVSLSSTTATTYYVLADGGDDCPTGNECHPLSYYTSHF